MVALGGTSRAMGGTKAGRLLVAGAVCQPWSLELAAVETASRGCDASRARSGVPL